MARNKKKKVIDAITVLDFAAEGKCFTRHENEVIFINTPNIFPGDIVKLQINRKRSTFSEAIVLNIIEKSPDRVEPFCTHFGVCGGCKWQHVPYQMQSAQKEKQVTDQLSRIGKVTFEEQRPILQAPETQYYRNKLEFTFSNTRWLTREEVNTGSDFDRNALGFHIPGRFDKVLPIDHCYLQAGLSNDIRNFFSEYAAQSGLPYYDHVAHEGFFRTLMIRTSSTGQTMVCLQFAQKNISEVEKCLAALVSKFPQLTSVQYFINQKRNDSYFDLNPILFYGQAFIEELMEGLRFRIGPKSFYQTNSEQAYNLYKVTRELAQLKGDEVIYDLYTGTGTIANFVAKQAAKVIGVEYVKEAIDDAILNAEVNNISNTQFVAGDMKMVLTDDFIEKHGKPDVIITDPPRAGMDRPVVDMLLKLSPKRIVYVSCNAATQARDLALLSEKYVFEVCQPVDMFPHTHHVENVVSMRLK